MSPKIQIINNFIIDKIYSTQQLSLETDKIAQKNKDNKLTFSFLSFPQFPTALLLSGEASLKNRITQPLDLSQALSYVAGHNLFCGNNFVFCYPEQLKLSFQQKYPFLIDIAMPISVLALWGLQKFKAQDLKSCEFLNLKEFKTNVFLDYSFLRFIHQYPQNLIIQDIFKPDNLKNSFQHLQKNLLNSSNLSEVLDFIFTQKLIDSKEQLNLLTIVIEKSPSYFSKPANCEIFLNTLLAKYSADILPYQRVLKQQGYLSEPDNQENFIPPKTQLTSIDIVINKWIQKYPSFSISPSLKDDYFKILNFVISALNTQIHKHFKGEILTLSHIQNFNESKKIVIETQKGTDEAWAQSTVGTLLNQTFEIYLNSLNDYLKLQSESGRWNLVNASYQMEREQNPASIGKKNTLLYKTVAMNIEKLELNHLIQNSGSTLAPQQRKKIKI